MVGAKRQVERDLRARFRERRKRHSAHRDGSPYLGDAEEL